MARSAEGIDYGFVTAAAAVIIGVCALGVSVYEARLMHVQQRASVLPILEVSSLYDRESYSVAVVNKGIGPAVIRDVKVAVDGEAVGDWVELYRTLVGSDTPSLLRGRTTGNVLRPDEEVIAVRFEGEHARQVWRQAERASLTACYCSVVDQCWRYTLPDLNSDLGRSVEIEGCPRGSRSAF